MLDPVISAKIKKFGLFKWALMDYPYMVVGATLAFTGITFGIYFAYLETQKHGGKAAWHSNYFVVRPNDPRLKHVKVWGPDERYPKAEL